ncbi:uncharacterized protein LOC135390197 [Ornithodoros turicata]|uniref:uncharacterized protein LOC135390197 n=1 Tax=Ornithodoros turicata TaxID=34597 RepID=UPI003138B8E3
MASPFRKASLIPSPGLQDAEDTLYGISETSRVLLIAAFIVFVVGGAASIGGVAYSASVVMYSGLVVCILGVGMYTIVVMFTTINGPPAGIELRHFEAVVKVKPATFRPSFVSKCLHAAASAMFSTGCVMVVLGFRHRVLYMWIPGYTLSLLAFLLYTMTVMYGPLDIKPGAVIIAFPDDNVLNFFGEEEEEFMPPMHGKSPGSQSRDPMAGLLSRDARTPGTPTSAAGRKSTEGRRAQGEASAPLVAVPSMDALPGRPILKIKKLDRKPK